MPSLRDFLLTILNEVEYVIDMHTFYVKRSLNLLDPLMVQPYLGFGNATKVTPQGRLLENEDIEIPQQDAFSWQNFKTMVHRYGSDEIPYARIRAIFGDQEQMIETDVEGYFRVTFTDFALPHADRIWHPMDLELLDSFHGQQETVKATGQFIIPQKSEFGVISDVDDTILVSHSADFVKKI